MKTRAINFEFLDISFHLMMMIRIKLINLKNKIQRYIKNLFYFLINSFG